MYFQGTTEEIPENTIIQMMGRAGRLQQDTTGTVLILTKEESKVSWRLYKILINSFPQLDFFLFTKLNTYFNRIIHVNKLS